MRRGRPTGRSVVISLQCVDLVEVTSALRTLREPRQGAQLAPLLDMPTRALIPEVYYVQLKYMICAQPCVR